MEATQRRVFSIVVFSGLLALALLPSWAGSHNWAPNEIYSNADGTIQFIELYNATGANETGISTRFVQSNANTSGTFGFNLPAGSTEDKYLLVATQGFIDLPGAPQPDLVVPIIDGFFSIGGDTIRWWTYTFSWSTLTFGPGDLPVGGDESLSQSGSTDVATPTNFAGDSFAPPGVPSSGTPLTVGKLPGFPSATRVELNWNDSGCFGAREYQIVYGFGSQLPSSPGGAFALEPVNAIEQCNILASPKIWSDVPDPAGDPSRLLWFLVLANDGQTTEGSWGGDGDDLERVGPSSGASGQCGVTGKSLVNTCGQ